MELIVTRDRHPDAPRLSVILDGIRFSLNVADVAKIKSALKER